MTEVMDLIILAIDLAARYRMRRIEAEEIRSMIHQELGYADRGCEQIVINVMVNINMMQSQEILEQQIGVDIAKESGPRYGRIQFINGRIIRKEIDVHG